MPDLPGQDGSLSRLTAAGLGFGSTLGQTIILRETLVLFAGFELAMGLVFSSWLFWTALGSWIGARQYRSHPARPQTPALGLACLALLLPLTLLTIRAARILWSIPMGEIPSLGSLAGICFLHCAPFCLVSGLVFTSAWSLASAGSLSSVPTQTGPKTSPLLVYSYEALGAAIGGIAFHFLLLPRVSLFLGCLAVSLALVMASAPTLAAPRKHGAYKERAILAGTALVLTAALAFSPTLDRLGRAWQWGPNFLLARETPYQSLAVTKQAQQWTFYSGGLWAFSSPDPQSAEYATHLALLQHPAPANVLLVEGPLSDLAPEILKHASVRRLDYLAADPKGVEAMRDSLPETALAPVLDDPRIRILHQDPVRFARYGNGPYDVILCNAGDPANAQLNRLYSLEFFRSVRTLLAPRGIFSFAVHSSPEALGPVQIRFLRSIASTLDAAFPETMVFPGDAARFFASPDKQTLTNNPALLTQRMAQRGLDLLYIREDSLRDLLSPFSLGYLNSVLSAPDPAPLNRDFEPVCYGNTLLLWARQLHPGLASFLQHIAELPRAWLLAAVAALALAMAAATRRKTPRTTQTRAISLAVFVSGGAFLAGTLGLLLAFQVLAGTLYSRLVLIITSYMAGLALGAGLVAGPLGAQKRALGRLALCQAAVSLSLLAAAPLFTLMRGWGDVSLTIVFTGLALGLGLLGGLHFSWAARAAAPEDEPGAHTGGKLYGFDLLGSALGSLVASILLLPLFGLQATLQAFAILSAGCFFTLLTVSRPGNAE